jgi:hypothetical protein
MNWSRRGHRAPEIRLTKSATLIFVTSVSTFESGRATEGFVSARAYSIAPDAAKAANFCIVSYLRAGL